MIRLVGEAELSLLQDIERAAGVVFRDLGMLAVADDQPPGIEVLRSFQQAERAWVFVDESNDPVAYLLVDVVDDRAHIEQVSVHPAHAHRGIGRRLIDHAEHWANQRGLHGLTLTTFTEVPWNGPYYQRLGFRVIQDDELRDGLRAIRQAEARKGLDRWPRAAMIRE